MPNVIADFIGGNVNDIAGNCSDLLESFVATTAAGILIASTLFASGELSASSYDAAMMYPVIYAHLYNLFVFWLCADNRFLHFLIMCILHPIL